MDDHFLLFLVLFPLISVGGIALLWIGLSSIRKTRLRAEQERAMASGTVVDVVKHLSLGRGKPLIFWHPVVEFMVEGRTQRHESRIGYRSEQLTVGERVDILYDADDPSHYHLEKLSEWEATGDRVTVVVGIIWIVVAGVIAFIVSQ
jgi:hypothetical protein